MVSSMGQTIVRLGASVIIARILTPYDYGLFGMAVLTSDFIAHTTRFGMDVAIIVKPDINEKDLNTCFWSMSASRLIMFSLLFFMVAPLAASFFGESRLELILRVISFQFLLSIPSIIPSVLLRKNLEFTPIILIESAGMLLESLTAVILVLTTDFAYWALVCAMIAGSVFSTTALFIYKRWLPQFMFDRESFHFQFKYGISNMGSTALNFLKNNIDYILIGRILGATSLGYYEFAYRIPHLIFEKIVAPSTGIIFSAFSKLEGDNEKINAGFIKTTSYLAIFILPALMFLASFTEPIVLLVWGSQWLPIVGPLRILCAASIMLSLFNPIFPVFLCKGKPQVALIYNSIQVPLTFVMVYVFGKYFDLAGVAFAMAISAALVSLLLIPLKRITNFSFIAFGKAVFPPVLCTAIALTTSFGIMHVLAPYLAYYTVLFIIAINYLIVYFLIFSFLFIRRTHDVFDDIKIIIDRKK